MMATKAKKDEDVKAEAPGKELPVVGVLTGYSCPFCGSQNLRRIPGGDNAPVLHFECRGCRRKFAKAAEKVRSV